MYQIEDEIWRQASSLLGEKRLPESKGKFQELLQLNGHYVARGYYGLGLVEKMSGHIDEATKAFEQALKIDPAMEGAARSLAQLAPRGVYGTYEFLREHPAPQAQDALVLMNELRGISERRPSMTAYLSQFFPLLLASLILLTSLIIAAILLNNPGPVARTIGYLSPNTVILICFIVVLLICLHPIVTGAWRFLKVQSTRYTILHGRIYVTVGILKRKTAPYELFRVRFINLEQSFLNRLTKDGTLVINLEIERGETKVVRITGLARGEALQLLHRQLINLVGFLRNVPEVKGFIQ